MSTGSESKIFDSLDGAYPRTFSGEDYEGVRRRPSDLKLEAQFLAQQALAKIAEREGEEMVLASYEQSGHMGD